YLFFFFFSSRRRHTIFSRDWSSDVCSSDLSLRKVLTFFASRSVAVPTMRIFCGGISCNRSANSARHSQPRFIALRLNTRFSFKRSEERRVGKEYRLWKSKKKKKRQ